MFIKQFFALLGFAYSGWINSWPGYRLEHFKESDPKYEINCPADYLGRAKGTIEYWDWEYDKDHKPTKMKNFGNKLVFDVELKYFTSTGEGVPWWQAFENCNDLGRPYNNETKQYMREWEPLYELATIESLQDEDCIFHKEKNNAMKFERRPDFPLWIGGLRNPEDNEMYWVHPDWTHDYEFKVREYNYRKNLVDFTDINFASMDESEVHKITPPDKQGKEYIPKTNTHKASAHTQYTNWYVDERRSYYKGPETGYDVLTDGDENRDGDGNIIFPLSYADKYMISTSNVLNPVNPSYSEDHQRNCLVVSNAVKKNQSFKWITADCFSRFRYVCRPNQGKIQKFLTDYENLQGGWANEPYLNNNNKMEYSKNYLKFFACQMSKGGAGESKLTYKEFDQKTGLQTGGDKHIDGNDIDEGHLSKYMGIVCTEPNNP